MKKYSIFFFFILFIFVQTVTGAAAGVGESLLRVENSGFEQPVIENGVYRQIKASDVPYWNTTAYEQKIEIMRENTGVYIPNVKLEPRRGAQAAELNADEQSSLYQYVRTSPGSLVKWGISHRGRQGIDTMLLVIGPKQSVDPAKPSKTGLDQFMKLGRFIRNNETLGAIVPAGTGCSTELVVYSPRFAKDGGFVTGVDEDFSLKKTAVHSEEWHVWVIRSDNDAWYDYGTNDNTDSARLSYNNVYDVPKGQKETIFAFTAYECASKSLTVGNLIDALDFGFVHRLKLATMEGGGGAVYEDGSREPIAAVHDLDVMEKNATVKAGSVVQLVATPAQERDYGFVGAMIDGEAVGYTAFLHNPSDQTYSRTLQVEQDVVAKLVFARNGHILYDPNGGRYKDGEKVVDAAFSYYTNGREEVVVPEIEDATFTGWRLFTKQAGDTAILIPSKHTVIYDAADVADPVLKITYPGANGELILPAKRESGITFVAEYNYTQAIDVYTKEEAQSYTLGTTGGTVEAENQNTDADLIVTGAQLLTSGEIGDVIALRATPAEGYAFDGWFTRASDTVPQSKALFYTYVVTGTDRIEARFSKLPPIEAEEPEEQLPQEEKKEEQVIGNEQTAVDAPMDVSDVPCSEVPPYVVPHFSNEYAYIYGYSNQQMGPNGKLLRGELCAMVYRLAKQNNSLTGFSYNAKNASVYADARGTWYRSAVEFVAYKGAFDPALQEVGGESPISRGESFKIICLALGFTEDTSLSTNQYATILVDAGLVFGYGDGSLGLNNTILRSEFCALFNRIIGRSDAALQTEAGEEITAETYGFIDLPAEAWYYNDVLRATSAYEGGLVKIEKRAVRNNLDDYDE